MSNSYFRVNLMLKGLGAHLLPLTHASSLGNISAETLGNFTCSVEFGMCPVLRTLMSSHRIPLAGSVIRKQKGPLSTSATNCFL